MNLWYVKVKSEIIGIILVPQAHSLHEGSHALYILVSFQNNL
jgi:hypothetical protein